MNHFQEVHIDQEEYNLKMDKPFTILRNKIASSDVIEENLVDDDKAINDLHVYTITCMSEGSGVFRLTVGNQGDPTDNSVTATDSAEIDIVCSMPSKLNVVTVGDGVVRDSRGTLFADNTKELRFLLTAKDKEGNTFENIESLQFDLTVPDKSLIEESKSDTGFVVPKEQYPGHSSVKLPGKPYHTLIPRGEEGTLEVTVKLSGYNTHELDKNEIKNPPTLPKIIEDEDYDEDETEYVEHNHDLIKYLTIKLVSPMKIKNMQTK